MQESETCFDNMSMLAFRIPIMFMSVGGGGGGGGRGVVR